MMTKPNIQYLPKVVAFVDILGFGTLIESTKEPKAAVDIIAALEEILSYYKAKIPNFRSLNAKLFSDCLMISSTSDDMISLLLTAWLFQMSMVRRGYFCRGGISFGNHYESDSLIFSQALVKAYRLESEVAKYPRIVLDDEVMGRLEDTDSEKYYNNLYDLSWDFVRRDSDAKGFVDYLAFFGVSSNRVPSAKYFPPAPGGYRLAELHRDHILQNIEPTHSDSSVREKFEWLINYHNKSVETYFGNEKSDLFLAECS